MRLDKFLSNQGIASRSQVKEYIRKSRVIVNEQVVKASDQQIDESKDRIYFDGELIVYQKNIYIMMNKPQGVVSATMDNVHKTAFDLLQIANKKELFIVGRLDLDTEGLLLITNDGELSHNLLSPKRHVTKTYQVKLERPITKEQVHKLEAGLDIGEDKLTLPASVQLISENEIFLSIVEGKFHQVKRMLQAVDNQVIFLRRVAIAGLKLDETLKAGEYRELTKDEYFQLTERE
jgi:16S rRNA pseudouridine516 synthase